MAGACVVSRAAGSVEFNAELEAENDRHALLRERESAPMRCLASVQPSYIPWRGYFHIIQKSDVFVFLDDVQHTRRDWRNRNRIKTASGSQWLTVPVGKVPLSTRINEVQLDPSSGWAEKHWNRIEASYARAPFFEQYAPALKAIYEHAWTNLSDLDIELTIVLCELLGIHHVEFHRGSDLDIVATKTDRFVKMCDRLAATRYLSGPAARSYIQPADFERAGLELEWMVYDYPEYEQLYPPFDPQISVIDLLFMKGSEAGRWIWRRREPTRPGLPRGV